MLEHVVGDPFAGLEMGQPERSVDRITLGFVQGDLELGAPVGWLFAQ
jgi:hypothetical protein